MAGGLLSKLHDTEHAKDFGPVLEGEGFKNLLETSPGVNLDTAPIGSVIVYRPVESQSKNGVTISGHIEIKYNDGYVSDYATSHPTYSTDKVSMVSPVVRSYNVKFKVVGIWYKDK